jgi:hypothetical protein
MPSLENKQQEVHNMILVALDGTNGSWQALEQALLQGNSRETWLLVHVIPDPKPYATGIFAPMLGVDPHALRLEWGRVGEDLLEAGKKRLKEYFGNTCEVLMRLEEAHNQSVGQVLAQIIRDEAPRLAVLGAHGEHPEVAALGRTAQWVVEHEQHDTLIVHPPEFEHRFEPMQRGGVR